ncbi:uncharacterized protein [Littorina saxatilis]|uniref:uncharacterized protein n=1 Tax=Littorina saxatilis TaxID=31220 RepID=UPI0038B48FBD
MGHLGDTILQQVEQNPYLGIQISADLKWGPHITSLCKRAGSTLGFLRRNLRNCPRECRRLAYITLVRSTLEYGAVVWDPYYKQDVERLERIQRLAARFIMKDYVSKDPGCVTKMLEYLQLPTLQERRQQLRLTMLFKIINGLVPALPPDSFLTPVSVSRRRVKPKAYEGYESQNILQRQATNNSRCFKAPTSKTDQYRNSFFIKTVIEWNNLSEATVTLTTPSAFSSALGGQKPV